MSRLPAIQTESAGGKAKQLLEAVQAKLKITPNMTRVMANSAAVLEGYLGFSAALAGGSLPARLREEIALEVGEQNGVPILRSGAHGNGQADGVDGSGDRGGTRSAVEFAETRGGSGVCARGGGPARAGYGRRF